MNTPEHFDYVPRIDATEANAIALQFLTLQDVQAGGFINPTEIADPENPDKVQTQLDKLTDFPEHYSGYQQENGLVVAYMKSKEWLVGDELPFIENAFARRALQVVGHMRSGSMYPKAYGVFGLVADDSLKESDQEDMLYSLLKGSVNQGLAAHARNINIVLHDNDPVLPIADDLGFKPIGERGEAAGAPGLKQQRYQREL